jgi:hypothetical protein
MADMPAIVDIVDGSGVQRAADWMMDTSGNVIPQTVPRSNGWPVDSTHALPVMGRTITPISVTGNLVLVASTVPQSLQQSVVIPGITVVICNPLSPIGQGIGSVESIWVDPVGVAQDTGGSTSMEIPPGHTVTIGPTTNAITWTADTGGHRIAAYAYI